jgi:hypothetical protein
VFEKQIDYFAATMQGGDPKLRNSFQQKWLVKDDLTASSVYRDA